MDSDGLAKLADPSDSIESLTSGVSNTNRQRTMSSPSDPDRSDDFKMNDIAVSLENAANSPSKLSDDVNSRCTSRKLNRSSVLQPGPLQMLATHVCFDYRKTRSLYGVSPNCKFGPKGFLLDCTSAFLKIPDPSSQKLNWLKTPLSVLVIKKPYDVTVTMAFRDLVVWLVQEKSLVVYAEESVVQDEELSEDHDFMMVQDKVQKFKEDEADLEDKVDFIICLGGDGTLLHASSMFQQSVPPVMAFNMGSLGFLTPFPFDCFKERIDQVLKGQAPLLLRYRLKCVMVNHVHRDQPCTPLPHVKNIDKNSHNISTHVLVLNEVVIDRGPSSYLCNLDLYIEGHLVTSVLGDGLIISTPTGSTAYSVAAGASMIHPNVPCILITPICPHSLSFRPIVVPAGAEIKVTLAPEARGWAMVSFDGRNRQEMHQGASLRITTATYPVPSICAHDQIEDWFNGLADCLHWNVRKPQKPLSSSASLNSLDSMDFDTSK